ncbi:hypothetical protein VTL71DRAFT_3810 [Oculimacula yallundae]|uniref:Glycoside hydrolase family 12 protein n=1 Tax=Oculimacula yallundae TaxID=86028 RepID=A0ABR4C417_9HELO
MILEWVLDAVLLTLPIGTTIGTLRGIDLHRQATGQEPLFRPVGGKGRGSSGNNGEGNSSTIISGNNGITVSEYCGRQSAVTPSSVGSQYTFNPNQWGWAEGDAGSLCMNITTFHNKTYTTPTMAPEFSVFWQYPAGPKTQPVHAYPNAQLESTIMPIKVRDIQHINIEMHWTYGLGTEAAVSTNVSELIQHDVNTNVAIDMFLDNEVGNSQSSTKARYEVMVWFARFGNNTYPIGYSANETVSTYELNGATFNLFVGQNSNQQEVFTWLASEQIESFKGDITPLLTQITTMNNASFPTGSTYLGHLSLGSEAFSANTSVMFTVPTLSIDIQG